MEVRKEIVLPTTREDAWEALTEPSRLEQWFATEVELDLREGGDLAAFSGNMHAARAARPSSGGATGTHGGRRSSRSRTRSGSSCASTTRESSTYGSQTTRTARVCSCARPHPTGAPRWS